MTSTNESDCPSSFSPELYEKLLRLENGEVVEFSGEEADQLGAFNDPTRESDEPRRQVS